MPDEAPNAHYVRQELRQLHASFSDAPLLGSLLDPARSLKNDLATSSYESLTALLRKALATERTATLLNEDVDRWELALSAQGLLEASRLLQARYHLVITNVPYLSRGKQDDRLKDYCETHYGQSKNDLANVFLERCLELSKADGNGVVQIDMPQNWLFLASYKKHREHLLRSATWNLLARLGPGAFETITGEVVQAILLTQTNALASSHWLIRGIDASQARSAKEKAEVLKKGHVISVGQKEQLQNPNSKVSLEELSSSSPLEEYAVVSEGLHTGDYPRFGRKFWEILSTGNDWSYQHGGVTESSFFSGMEHVLFWQQGDGELIKFVQERLGTDTVSAWIKGESVWGNSGLSINAMSDLIAGHYTGALFTHGVYAVVPIDPAHRSAIYAFCSDESFSTEVRKLDQKVAVARDSIAKVNFDLAYWQEIAAARYASGVPAPYSNDPTQWIFHGHIQPSSDPLQVAVARLVGYTWPAENDETMELSSEARAWIERSSTLAGYADKDGIVCIPPVGRESSASDRLLNMLVAAYGEAWSNDVLAQLLARAGHSGKSLETWLRNKFFTQHCTLFGNRPFVWHVWDGLPDGFGALVNYHKLDYKTLEALIYTYLGDWIGRQKRDVENGVDDAQEKLAAAETLKKRLELILAGEAPYDIFVRWKPIEKQPIGWNPDLNDGVRMNIRPFLSVLDVGKRGAGVLRDKPNIKWEKDRGSDVPSAPWYELGLRYGGKIGDRINDHHLTLAEKQAARAKTGKA